MSRERRVLEIGFGDGQRLFRLSSRGRMNKLQFLGVDKEVAAPARGQLYSNLRLEQDDAVDFVSRQQPDSHYHVYSLFTLKYIPYRERPKFFYHLKRILEPGRHFVAVEDSEFAPQMREELEKAGFKVTVENLSAMQLEKLDSAHALNRATTMRKFEQILSSLTASEASVKRRSATKGFVTRVEDLIKRVEGDRPDEKTRKMIKRVLRDARGLPPEKMVSLIRAFKPLEKKEVSK